MKIFIDLISIRRLKIFGKVRFKVKFKYIYKSKFRTKSLLLPLDSVDVNMLSEVRSANLSSAIMKTISNYIISLDWSYLKDNVARATHLSFCNLSNFERNLTLKIMVKI